MFGKLPSYSIPDGQEGLRGSNLEKAGCCFFQMGLFDFCRPERSYRESAPSGAVPATARALSAAVPLFYIAEKAMMKEGTRFRRKIYGLLPWALLLSSPKEVSKKGATGKRMNGIRPFPPSFLDTQKGSEKGATVSTRWTPTRELSPLDPALRNTYRMLPLPASTRPTLRAGGAGLSAVAKET